MKSVWMSFIILGLALGTSAFALTADQKHQIDEQIKQAKTDYENQKTQLESQYSGSELQQKLQQAKADYKAKVKQLDEEKNQ